MDPQVTYWAFGFLVIILSVLGVDFVSTAGTLYTPEILLPHEQSFAGVLFQTMTQV